MAVDADGELMGCVGINLARLAAPEGASGGEGPFAIVANLAVDPSRRRKGLAKRLMAEAEQFVREELGEDDEDDQRRLGLLLVLFSAPGYLKVGLRLTSD